MTTRDPGARLVFTHGFDRRPSATAFWATRPAASIMAGFEVLVHEVMAAIATEPLPRREPLVDSPNAELKLSPTPGSATRSWGRRGPATLGTTVVRSKS